MKTIADEQVRDILGTAILGTDGDQAIPSILDAMYSSTAYTVIRRALHIPPTISELIPTMLGERQPLARASTALAR